jgi:hypothetical protein
MKTAPVLAVVLMTGGLLAFTGLPSDAQHSSGGTPPSVTEGKGGSSGGSGLQGERHDSVNKRGQAESSGKMRPNERTTGSSSGSGSSGGSGSSASGSSEGSTVPSGHESSGTSPSERTMGSGK